MFLSGWRKWLRWLSEPSRSAKLAHLRRYRPRLDPLEDRLLLATHVVNSVGDEPDGNYGTYNDHIADTGHTPQFDSDGNLIGFTPFTDVCTLRAAIQQANADGAPAEIDFAIPGVGLHTIFTAGLPFITVPIVIDGTTQPGFDATNHNPVIELSGPKVGLGAPAGLPWSGLVVGGGDSTIRGLVINGYSGPGIALTSDGNRVEGNFIGTDATGTATTDGFGTPLGNYFGVAVVGSDNTVGGTTTAARNVISGNSLNFASKGVHIFVGNTGNTVEGNFIGTDVTGTKALPNSIGVCINGFGNTIGGEKDEDFNLISGNSVVGVLINSPASLNTVQGNFIGTDITGSKALGNGVGVQVAGFGNLIGGSSSLLAGTLAGAGNVISGNTGNGILITGSDAKGNTVQGNFVGTDAGGTAALPNESGVVIDAASGNTVGGTTADSGNVISGNSSFGVVIGGASGNLVQGNFIGTQADGVSALGNGEHGVYLTVGASDNTIGGTAPGAGNTVAFNGSALSPRQQGHGIVVDDGTGNAIRRNVIFKNAGRGIALGTASWADTLNDLAETALDAEGHRILKKAPDTDGGPNHLQNYPVLTSVISKGGRIVIKGGLDGAPRTTYVLEFFTNDDLDSSGFGEGQTFLGSMEVTTNEFGHADVAADFASAGSGRYVAATATDTKTNDTSPFSLVDTDGDGLADAWEQDGIDVNEDGKVDLVLAGADRHHKDVYVEVDAMQDRAPAKATLQMVVDAFAAAPDDLVHNPDAMDGVTLHTELDETDIRRTAFPNVWSDFAVVKRDRFGTPTQRSKDDPNHDNTLKAKGLVYRYCLFADTYEGGNSSGASRGLVTNDFMVTLGSVPTAAQGGWLLPGPDGEYGTADDIPGTTREQAGTFMHELGHTLGLHHGGGGSDSNGDGDDTHFKPNYHSVMNYLWQTPFRLDPGVGTPEDPKGGTADEKAFYNSWTLDYSREAMRALDETRLNEANGIGGHAEHTLRLPSGLFVPESGPVDLDGDGSEDEVLVNSDVNGDRKVTRLLGHEDWSQLTYSFLESQNYAAKGADADDDEELTPDRLTPWNFADLSVTVTPSADVVRVGEEVTYTMTIANHGPASVPSATLTDRLPEGVILVSARFSRGDSTLADGILTGNLGTLGSGDTATLTLVVLPAASRRLTNTVKVVGNVADLARENNSVISVLEAAADAPLSSSAPAPASEPERPVIALPVCSTSRPRHARGPRRRPCAGKVRVRHPHHR